MFFQRLSAKGWFFVIHWGVWDCVVEFLLDDRLWEIEVFGLAYVSWVLLFSCCLIICKSSVRKIWCTFFNK